MLGLGLGTFIKISSLGFDPDAQAFFDRVTTAGGVLTSTEQTAVNQLVLDMKSAGIWNSMKAVYPMVGASAAACAQNLKSSSFTGTFSGGWTFSSTGALPNGTSGFFTTSIIPNSSLLLNNTHLSAYSRTNSSSGGLFGCYDAAAVNGLYTNPRFSGTTHESRNNSGAAPSTISADSTGLWINSRIVSNQFKVYRNSTIHQTANVVSTGLSSRAIAIGGINANGVNEYQNREIAFGSVGDGLDDTQASNFYTAVQAFQTTLSRQV